MDRLHTVITGALTMLLLTSAAVGALSSGSVTDAVAGVSEPENSTATDDGTTTATDGPTAAPDAADGNVTAAQAEAALGPFLDELDVDEPTRQAVLEQAAEMRANGAGGARIVAATLGTLHERGVPAEELRESAWRLELGLLLAQLDLTDEQREAVVDVVEAKRADDADAAEIRRAAGGKLIEYGVERGEVKRAWRNVRHVKLHLRMYRLQQRHRQFHADDEHPDGLPAWAHRLQHRHDLTDEQVHEIVDTAREMRENGASREEIKRMVYRKLREFGADPDWEPPETATPTGEPGG